MFVFILLTLPLSHSLFFITTTCLGYKKLKINRVFSKSLGNILATSHHHLNQRILFSVKL